MLNVNYRYFVSIVVLGAVAVVFQNCSQTKFDPGANVAANSATGSQTDPTDPGGNVVLPTNGPCANTSQPITFDAASLNLNLIVPDAGVVFAQGDLNAGTAVYAERLKIADAANNVIFAPGASYSPNNPTPGIVAQAIGFLSAGNYQLSIEAQTTQAISSSRIHGTFYPLCGTPKVIWYRYKSDSGSATSGQPFSYDITLTESAQVIVAVEKTVTNVPNHLSIGVQATNLDTNTPITCALQGTTVWNYSSPSTPSVSGSCTLNLSAGHYRFTNVIASDGGIGTNASQHLGILALHP